uniref:Murine leukemia virus integrase C-terminal domain-containing protein n=1 Tax=Molossus molossus TaxID=27622 RepID=A0A7J8CS86_MOLMO|nr:hypothetical protein HJG59_009797 [Molossus molossus]
MLAINPASLPPDDDQEKLLQDCLGEINTVQMARPDLKDVPLPSSDESSRQVEHMNRTLKKTLTKFTLETRENWTTLLPLALLQFLQALQSAQKTTHKHVCDALPVPTLDPLHPFQPGDSVWVKKFTTQGLTPAWKGLYTVILPAPTAVKVNICQGQLHPGLAALFPA